MRLAAIVVTIVTCGGWCKDIRNREPQFGYNYPVPFPPFADEISTTARPAYSYVPPMLDLPQPNQTLTPEFPGNPYLPPGMTFQPDPVPVDDTVVIPANEFAATLGQYEALSPRLRVFNVSCLDDPVRGYFRASLALTRAPSAPVIDDAPTDCVSVTGNGYRLDVDGERMKKCLVRYCANGVNMCVTVRVPGIRGLKLGDDVLLSLRCRPQDRVVSHTKRLKWNTRNVLPQARAIPTVAVGGAQRGFSTQVTLLRKSSAGRDFSVPVDPGSAVQLGEELLLRAAVRDGDGWRYSRMAEVLVHHVSSTGAAQQRPVTLVDSAGCRDARLRAVCPEHPAQTSPLVTTLSLRAFMFQGTASTDEMVLSVRMIACLHFEDCHSLARVCDGKIAMSSRQRRHTDAAPNQTTDFQSYVEFRVETPLRDVRDDSDASLRPQAVHVATVLMGGLLGLVVVAALVTCRLGLRHKVREQD